MKTLHEAGDLRGKAVLVRVDFNVWLNQAGNTNEHFKLDIAKETVDFVVAQGARVVALLTHFGRPDGKVDPAFSVEPLFDDVEKALGRRVRFVADCQGEKVKKALREASNGEILLLENVRFYAEEEQNDASFAQLLAEPFDIFVNDAFSVCHRAHTSVACITKLLPSYAGFRLVTEVAHLETLQHPIVHPAVAIIGGAKIETKLPIIRNFERLYDCVLIGGKIANEAIDQQLVFSKKVLLPEDFADEKRMDIGVKTIERFVSRIADAKMIVWNGPMGKFEEEAFAKGTKAVLTALCANTTAIRVIGGGESLASVEEAGVIEQVGFVSAGGGAMLDFLGGEQMPGLDALSQ
jgi:3-phosphoglycerate kinase